MSKVVTAFLGRKSNDPAKNSSIVAAIEKEARDNNGVPSVAEIGSRLGKEHEALRMMLNDAAQRIGSLDLVKEAYDKVSEPIVKTIQALEQEKAHNAALKTMFASVSATHEKQRTELQASKLRTTALEGENEKLREELELAREQVRSSEATRLKLTGEITAKRDQIGNLERHLAHETTERQRFADERASLSLQVTDAEKRIILLQSETATEREKGVLTEAELFALRKSLDEAIAESSRLARRLTESDGHLASANIKIAKLGSEIAAATSDRDRLANALDDANGRHQAETHSLNARLEALQARSQSAEKLLAETRQALALRTDEARTFDRNGVETMITLNVAEKKNQELAGAVTTLEGLLHEGEQTHEALTERNNGLARNLREREQALVRAEEHNRALADRIAKLEADSAATQVGFEKRVDEVNAAWQREHMERSMIEGALETMRRDYAVLHQSYSELQVNGARAAVC